MLEKQEGCDLDHILEFSFCLATRVTESISPPSAFSTEPGLSLSELSFLTFYASL
jgi:hypothetical protein